MTFRRIATIALLLFCASGLSAEDKSKLGEHPFFKHLIGSWKSKGELKAADGTTVKIAEEWTCKITDEGALRIEGTRAVNDAVPEKFHWNISHNPTTDLYEATQGNPDDPSSLMRFEGSIIGDPPALELKSQFGPGGGSAAVTDTFTGEGYDAFDTKVILLNDSGGTNLEGTIKNERVK